jgi:hypothetical protein
MYLLVCLLLKALVNAQQDRGQNLAQPAYAWSLSLVLHLAVLLLEDLAFRTQRRCLQARDRMLDAGGQLSGIRLMRLVELQQLLQDLFGVGHRGVREELLAGDELIAEP